MAQANAPPIAAQVTTAWDPHDWPPLVDQQSPRVDTCIGIKFGVEGYVHGQKGLWSYFKVSNVPEREQVEGKSHPIFGVAATDAS